ncbi:LPS assembly lipoprotein LptE [Ferrovibrio sp.]|uniref:LPS assembly lipoprotein LptE n=1 Tax=Ferrovibrio sp. TaxID=1917215 RepID=UPI0025C5799E|nr:LPS assembly lipoprotein LptE [Ferrovibrio sp.]MBX3455634.1 hypothetical protein [Ferrovibrio sp.]
MWWRNPSRRTAGALLLAGLPLLLAGCGFRPLYGTGHTYDAVPEFSALAVEQAEDRSTQLLRNHLLDMLTPRGAPEKPAYRLELKVAESVSSVLVTRSDEITRNNLQMTVTYRLIDYRSGVALQSNSLSSLVSYNLVRAEYANLVSERDARARAARDLAEQIRIRLGNFFTQQRKAQVK